jgi:hypothetical protein
LLRPRNDPSEPKIVQNSYFPWQRRTKMLHRRFWVGCFQAICFWQVWFGDFGGTKHLGPKWTIAPSVIIAAGPRQSNLPFALQKDLKFRSRFLQNIPTGLKRWKQCVLARGVLIAGLNYRFWMFFPLGFAFWAFLFLFRPTRASVARSAGKGAGQMVFDCFYTSKVY